MPDSIPAVGAMVKPPDPNQGFQSLSNIYGIQQQKQQLQTGQYLQQTAQAAAQSNVQNTKEKLALASLLRDPVGNGIIDEDGQPTKNAQSIIMGVAPTTGAEHYKSVVDAAKSRLDFVTGANNLNASERLETANAGLAALSNPDAKPKDFDAAMDAFLESKKGTPAEGDFQKITGVLKKAVDAHATDSKTIAPPGQELWRKSGQALVLALHPDAAVPQISNNAAGQQVYRPNVFGTEQTLLTGSNPTSSQVAGATAQSTGGAGIDVDRANTVGGQQQSARAAIELTKQIDHLADEISSGHLAKMISETGNYLGFSSVNEARAALLKNLGQVKGLAIANAGSDSRAATVLEGYPTDTTPAEVTHKAMDYIRGTARQQLARGALLDKHGQKGFAAADNTLTGTTDPLMHEYISLAPAQRAAFYKRNFSSPQEAQAFKDKVNAVKAHAPGLLGQ